MLLVCLWLLHLMLTVSSLRLEVVQEEEGEEVILLCTTENNKNLSIVTWTRLVGNEYVPVKLDGRILKKTSPGSQSRIFHMLHMNKLHRGDGGSYHCESQNGQVLQEVLLQVYKLPVIFKNSTYYEEIMWEEDKDLWCWADGYPGLSIVWTRADNQLFNAGEHSFNGQHLKVIKARQEYAGEYYCTASIRGFRNASVSHKVTLVVEGPPHNSAVQNEFYVSPGDNVTLPCAVVGYPEPDVIWSRTGKVMSGEITRYLVTEVPIHQCAKNSSLNVIGVAEDDYETYTCEVKNDYGKAEVQYTIKRHGS